MEQVHGVDVSWMTQASPKDKFNKKPSSPPLKTPAPAQPRAATGPNSKPTSVEAKTIPNGNHHPNGNSHAAPATTAAAAAINSQALPIGRRSRSRSGSVEKNGTSPLGSSPGRRNSWFSNISAKFSSNHAASDALNGPPQEIPEQEDTVGTPPTPPQPSQPRVPQVGNSRSAVLPPAQRPTGNGPYTPAPPRTGQAGILGVFRRLSSSGANHHAARTGNGLVERRVLNVDQNRQRCPISELKDAKMKKVSFCVDVEIAPMPKYADPEVNERAPVDTASKKKVTEKGEGEALKNPKAMEEKKEAHGEMPLTPVEPKPIPSEAPAAVDEPAKPAEVEPKADHGAPENTKKKEKKKKSEEERKARKEKKRKLAEANGSIPMEIRYSSDSSDSNDNSDSPKTQHSPTINPVRIYRRCCQLRESPILKKVTEQLLDPTNSSEATGVVGKLDLTGYYLQSVDITTLGDYLAVVPVIELILEDCNLNDEGLRMVLAGLLAARRPDPKRRKAKHEPEGKGGVIERLVIKSNKIGPDGWKHISLFLYHCRSIKHLDLSRVQFPRQAACQSKGTLPNGVSVPQGIAEIFAAALTDRLGGSLELLNLGETLPAMDQLGTIIDGVIKCGVSRLGLANNKLDAQGVAHVNKFLASGKCVGLDLGGNDLRDHIGLIAEHLRETDPLWALSLSACNIDYIALGTILSVLTKLENFRFIDLSHNHDLFPPGQTEQRSLALLRKNLPKMKPLKRIHLQDVGMNAEQAIALIEILPEVPSLAHINLLENADLVKLADARSEEDQEEACALHASLMAAARLSKSLICIDIEVPSEGSGEIVKAMAKQVVAYCLRNMERIHDPDIGAAVSAALGEAQTENGAKTKSPPGYPDVLAHLVGHDVLDSENMDTDEEPAPDEDYVIGGTGVVKALTCCLKNRGDDSRRPSGEFTRDANGDNAATKLATAGKAKDMSKHLLAGARKIRLRIQPALVKARTNPADEVNLRKLIFLDDTLKGIIKRFEDEYPDTREGGVPGTDTPPPQLHVRMEDLSTTPPGDDTTAISDGEDDSKIRPAKALSRSSSVLSKLLAEEEGRVHRAGHRFRSGFFTKEQVDLLTTIDDIGSDPKHVQLLTGLADDIGGELLEAVKEKGPTRVFKEDREMVLRCMKEADPEHYDRFVESQKTARANISVSSEGKEQQADESAVTD
ncbi:HMG2-induced ER-remodeling protein-like protein [Emericellopsis cladophorae]|uniref:HMG2-induced ER-remodeling protein-like protein n=1 Tax=Emericellopsis cladophorae TaxID=2686198 RepID=A0A9Q0BDL8_9HYPO|nr:HMG2-induced ER-remodeling protein-like protein [Emericellopsis cladophorae]KAI6782027.1 HMG2-induced ER-remodeling protein-like protein [Emericellopsis cladophorae]